EFTDCVIDGIPLPIVEIVPNNGFYDYKNKYQAGATTEICPAEIPEETTKMIQEEAVKAYKALGIQTYARMDFMQDEKTGNIYCLEANTLPGMTPTSLIPQEANAIGKSYNELCQWIIDVSMNKYK
ncbi:MAG: D-alanine--D-alanine ligase, partial [Lachnospiraceae bacterium]|nr:D-alanine--D-alanine ligase [Lachnospiraceae bacterium]